MLVSRLDDVIKDVLKSFLVKTDEIFKCVVPYKIFEG